jgi:hypothetical protein
MSYIPPHLRAGRGRCRGQQTGATPRPAPPQQGRSLEELVAALPAASGDASQSTESALSIPPGDVRNWAPSRHQPVARFSTGPFAVPRTHRSLGPSASTAASGVVAIAAPAAHHGPQTEGETYQYSLYARNCVLLQPRPIGAEACEEGKEYAQWAGGFAEVTDKLVGQICPCNLVGKPCAFDELPDGCSMIRLCPQLEKWTIHKCPDKGFRTIVDAAENVPANYGERFGTVNLFDVNESVSGGAPLDSSSSDTDSTTPNKPLAPISSGPKVSFNDFSCGIKNDCGHIHWEVEINCRFVGWAHVKNGSTCKQVLDKGRLCSCGHDFETARQNARDKVKAHERAAVRAGAPEPDDLGRHWMY